ncbi:MAG: NAD-dependent epimerase/dehydratase family protein [Nitrospirae bacterium]|nr:NAD-dependent epimerase/dehydratase family protein [Nitrospirota bacterium]
MTTSARPYSIGTALVTGAAGFIGSNLVRLLSQHAERIIALDNLSTGYLDNLDGIPRVKFVQGDVRHPMTVQRAAEGAEVIFHLAAQVGNLRSLEDPVADLDVNVMGTVRLLEAARKMKIPKFIYSSSAAIFGEPVRLPISESHPLAPPTPYAASKLAGEQYALCYSQLHGIGVVCLRYFNVYGPHQRYDAYGNVIPIFARRMHEGGPLRVYGSGKQTRDFVHVADVARANLLAAVTPGTQGVFNIGSGIPTTVNDLVHLIRSLSGSGCEVEYHPARPGEVLHSVSDISAARSVLGYRPHLPLREGLADYLAWSARCQEGQDPVKAVTA